MRTDVRRRLGRAFAAVVVGAIAVTGMASSADAASWPYRHHGWHHWYQPYWSGWRPAYGWGYAWPRPYWPAPARAYVPYYAPPAYGYPAYGYPTYGYYGPEVVGPALGLSIRLP